MRYDSIYLELIVILNSISMVDNSNNIANKIRRESPNEHLPQLLHCTRSPSIDKDNKTNNP